MDDSMKKNMKKPSFREILTEKILISFAVAILFATATLIISSAIYRSSRDEFLGSIYSQTSININETIGEYGSIFTEDQYRDMLAKINFNMITFYCSSENEKCSISARMVDIMTTETLADSQEKYILLLRQKDGNYRYFLAEEEMNERILSAYHRLSKQAERLNGGSRSGNYSVEMISAYLKDNRFLPVIALAEFDYSAGRTVIVESVDFASGAAGEYTAANIYKLLTAEDGTLYTGGYIKTAETDFLSICSGTKENASSAKALNRFFDLYGTADISRDTIHLNGCYLASCPITIPSADGTARSARIYFSGTDSFIHDFSPWIEIACAALILITAFIACIAARLQYIRQKAQYEITENRRETTNAMAHDLKTPLASISGYSEMLQENIRPDKQQYYLDKIGDNVRQMNNILGDILNLAKAEAITADINPCDISVKSLTEELLSFLEGTARIRSLRFRIEGDTNIRTDRRLFSQSLLNLLQNAVEYSAEKTEISVRITPEAVRISNTPRRMPTKTAEELIKPFIRDNDARGENQGSGIGLAIADANLEKLGIRLKISLEENLFTAECIF